MIHTRPVLLSTVDEFGVWHTLALNILGFSHRGLHHNAEVPISGFMLYV
jgi:hypothetical protein